MLKGIDEEIAKRIELLRYCLIVGVVYVHIPVLYAGEYSYAFETFKFFVADAVARASVPLLTCISGYLLFSSGLHRHYGSLVAKKFRSLFVPLVVVNLATILLLYAIQAGEHWTPNFRAYYPFDTATWLNGVLALTQLPINPPLYFLRDLFVVCLMAPCFHFLIVRMPLIGLLLLILAGYYNLDGPLLFRGDIAINFYVGGLLALRRVDVTALDRYGPVLLFVFLFLCLLMALFRLPHSLWFQLGTPLMIWPLSGRLLGTAFGRRSSRLGQYSFFLFLSHSFVLAVLWRAYYQLDPGVLHYPYFWLVAPLLTLLITRTGYDLLYRRTPRLLQVIVGRPVTGRQWV